MTSDRNKAVSRRGDAGFTIIAILVIVAVIAALSATYSRHVVVYVRSSDVSASALEADEVIDSQIDFVLRSQQVGTNVSSTTVHNAVMSGAVGTADVRKDETDITFSELKTAGSPVMDRSSLLARVISPNGIGATRLVETARAPAIAASGPTSLPRVQMAIVAALALDVSVPKIPYLASTLIQDADLDGILIVHPGVVLTLDNVVIRGAIVSSGSANLTALAGFDPIVAPRVDIQGPVRIVSQPFLEGLAVHLPEGQLTSTDVDARLQVQGDVIAHTLQLDCAGAITGGIAAVAPLALGAGVVQVGAGRGPRTWSPVLDHRDVWDPEFIAFVPRELTVSDLTAISSYQVP